MDVTVATDILVQIAYALGIGLVVGLEREHNSLAEGIAPTETPADRGVIATEGRTALGVRTFALLALFGWISGYAGQTWAWVPPLALVAVVVLVAAEYVVTRGTQGVGLTTESAALITFVLGLIVHRERALAVALALATTLLLIAKPWVHSLVIKLRRVELSATLQLLVLLAIVLPLLPSEPLDPWGALPPRKIGLFVILIAGLSYVGYILSRVVGGHRGVGLTGILGGLTSSTAVTVTMSKLGSDEHMRRPAQLAVFLANTIMFGRVIVITAVLSRDVAMRLALPMSLMAAVMLGAALWKWLAMRRHDGDDESVSQHSELRNPFALLPALTWGVVLSAVLLFATLAQNALGDRGVLVAAATSGLADVDAITLAVTRQAADQTLSIGIATLAITIAVVSNTLIKAGMALVGGGRGFGVPVGLVAVLAVAVGITGAALS